MKRSNDLAIEHRVRGIVKKLTRDWGEPALKRALYRAQVIVYHRATMQPRDEIGATGELVKFLRKQVQKGIR